MTDTTIQTKTCLHCQSTFTITQADRDFYAKISPTFAGQTFSIPTPIFCPACRRRQRLSLRNDRIFYRRTCDASGKQIISMYQPDCEYKVYDQKIWRSDSRDPMHYRRDFDFTKTFTENFDRLMHDVPRLSMDLVNCENSDYCNYCGDDRNCYIDIAGEANENCYYDTFVKYSTYCIDCLCVYESQECYMSVHCNTCYNVSYSIQMNNCSHCRSCIDCIDCSFCYRCSGLSNKKYCIDNKQVTKEEFDSYMQTVLVSFPNLSCYKLPLYHINAENCTGNYITNSKNAHDVYNVGGVEDGKFLYNVLDAKYCHDMDYSLYEPEYSYQSMSTLGLKYSAFSMASHYCSSVYYCDMCNHSQNLFGCIGLKNKQYCIFNKQYTKEDYDKVVAKIISHMINTEEWGIFFHPSLSPFGYNETVAQEYYPLVQDGGNESMREGKISPQEPKSLSLSFFQSIGYKWSDYEAPKPISDKVIKGQDLPNTIDEVQDDILQYAIACEVTGKLFRIQGQELAFYRKHHIPLPRKHPDQRHLERLALRK